MYTIHGPIAHRMDGTVGLRTFMGRAWAAFVATGDFFRQSAIYNLCRFMLDELKLAHPANFEELVVGVGGGVENLAVLVVKQLNSILEYLASAVEETLTLVLFGGVFEVLHKTEGKPSLCAALMDLAFMGVLTAIICKIAPKSGGRLCSQHVSWLSWPRCRPLYWPRHYRGLINHDLEYLLRRGLPQALVYYLAVVQVDRTLSDAKLLASVPSFQASAAITFWLQLVSLADIKRIEILKHYENGTHPHPNHQYCNNDLVSDIGNSLLIMFNSATV
ncbi:hypothetical protein C8R44DRAFT_739834 [Mycena epipterygia]|nr:hypothetical protein C8R44DRAFT_739834 [Mycena epipterygia]